ncbi:glycosyltransferase [Tautonia rosea]|uniref:glycosyltransferase n=1 Tax=Tautonia rosea TaxID=2728037 RepID=UPI0019D00381|nr:glycosyltransferase [Tautonia rosea]
MPRLAYFVNSYPMPSQTFIRREIGSLEAQGIPVIRYAIRDSGLPRVDPDDQAEYEKTRRLLDSGAFGLLGALISTILTRPVRLVQALAATWRLGRRSERGLTFHLIYLAEACLLRRWAQRDQVSHLHVHFGTNSATVALLCHLLGGPSYSVTVHGPEEFDAPKALSLAEKVRHSAFTVAISSFGRSQLWRWADPGDWDKIHVVRCGLAVDFLDRPPTDPPEAPRFLNIGRLAPEKGQLVLIEAAAELLKRGRTFELTLVGDGPFRPILEDLIDRRGLSDHVLLAGWQSSAQVREALEGSRALVQSSFAEGLPVVIMEALALHRPVISTTIAGIPELIRTGESGWLVPAGSITDLADAMEAALDATPAELRRMGSAGAARVAANHDVRREAARLAELFPGIEPSRLPKEPAHLSA